MSERPLRIGPDQALDRLKHSNRILITTHARADGDAIACVLAMRRGLIALGKEVKAILHEGVMPRYQFVTDGEPHGVWAPAKAAEDLSWSDLLLVVDTCTRGQLGDVGEVIAGYKGASLAIDHHATRDNTLAEAWVDENASACAQLIAELFFRAGWKMDAKTATLLFIGMATDTGWFRFSNADARCFEMSGKLIEAGARPNELYERLFLNERPERARLVGEIMSSFELHAGGRLAVIKVTQEMLRRSGATPQMTEDLINEPQRIGSVNACVMLTEPSGNEPVRVSFRSKRDVNVAEIAGRFGGGGHERAAGARLPGPFGTACRQVIQAMTQAFE